MTADAYCYLTTTGHRTGRAHRIEIWYARDGDTLYLLAGGGHTAHWVRNLVADPAVDVEIGAARHHAHARLVDDPAEDARARDLVFGKYAPGYEHDLTDWRRQALPVVIDLLPQ